jgi:hypothetical protein
MLNLILFDGLTLERYADLVGVTPDTVRGWAVRACSVFRRGRRRLIDLPAALSTRSASTMGGQVASLGWPGFQLLWG